MSDASNPFASPPPDGAKDALKKVAAAEDATLNQAKVLAAVKGDHDLKKTDAPADAGLARAQVLKAVEGDKNLKHVDAPADGLSDAAKEEYVKEKEAAK